MKGTIHRHPWNRRIQPDRNAMTTVSRAVANPRIVNDKRWILKTCNLRCWGKCMTCHGHLLKVSKNALNDAEKQSSVRKLFNIIAITYRNPIVDDWRYVVLSVFLATRSWSTPPFTAHATNFLAILGQEEVLVLFNTRTKTYQPVLQCFFKFDI